MLQSYEENEKQKVHAYSLGRIHDYCFPQCELVRYIFQRRRGTKAMPLAIVLTISMIQAFLEDLRRSLIAMTLTEVEGGREVGSSEGRG